MKKKIIILALMIVLGSVSLTGCFAGWDTDKAVDGGVFSNSKGNYVVLNESGGQIMDCWVLRNTYIKSEDTSDGIRFMDEDGNGIIVQGDAKIVRTKDERELGKYIEYHIDKDFVPYLEFYKQNKK